MDADAKLKSKDIIEIQINKDVRHVYLTSLHEIEASIILRVNHLYNNNQALVPKFVVSNRKSAGRVCPVVDDG